MNLSVRATLAFIIWQRGSKMVVPFTSAAYWRATAVASMGPSPVLRSFRNYTFHILLLILPTLLYPKQIPGSRFSRCSAPMCPAYWTILQSLSPLNNKRKNDLNLLTGGLGWCRLGPPSTPFLRSIAFAISRCFSATQRATFGVSMQRL